MFVNRTTVTVDTESSRASVTESLTESSTPGAPTPETHSASAHALIERLTNASQNDLVLDPRQKGFNNIGETACDCLRHDLEVAQLK